MGASNSVTGQIGAGGKPGGLPGGALPMGVLTSLSGNSSPIRGALAGLIGNSSPIGSRITITKPTTGTGVTPSASGAYGD